MVMSPPSGEQQNSFGAGTNCGNATDTVTAGGLKVLEIRRAKKMLTHL